MTTSQRELHDLESPPNGKDPDQGEDQFSQVPFDHPMEDQSDRPAKIPPQVSESDAIVGTDECDSQPDLSASAFTAIDASEGPKKLLPSSVASITDENETGKQQAPFEPKKCHPWMAWFLMSIAGVFATAVAVISHSNHSPGMMADDQTADTSTCGQKPKVPADDCDRDAASTCEHFIGPASAFVHVLSTSFYAVTAPIDLFFLIRHHRRHRRRMPRICICLGIAIVGALICTAGWVLGHWMWGVGLTAVSSAHVFSIVIERTHSWARVLEK